MFSFCSNLFKLDLSSFNTYNVFYIKGMFYNCNNLFELDLSSFNIKNVIDMSYIFSNNKLKKININKLNNIYFKEKKILFNFKY